MQISTHIQHHHIGLRNSTTEDLDFIITAERTPENACFVAQWSREQHIRSFEHPDQAHLLVYNLEDGTPAGYIILTGFNDSNRCLDLLRLVISEKGKGFGREALQLVKKLAFEHFHAHRLWLDVMVDNQKALHLYRSEGFVHEGVLRENYQRDGQFFSHAILSMLEQEYQSPSV